MWFSSDHRGVRIHVRGGFVAPHEWLIQATVDSGSGAHKSSGAGDRQRTLSELWQGIMLESRVGRSRGAVAVRVVVDGDQAIAALFAEAGNVGAPTATAGLPESGDVEPRDPEAKSNIGLLVDNPVSRVLIAR